MTQTNYFPSNGHLFYFWKGRVALYTMLKALGIGPGDEVILPGFTCVVVPNAILYLGATPVYADIEPESYTLSAATVAPHLSERTKVIIAQNSFGLSADLDPIMQLVQQRPISVIEDCAHGLGGSYRGRPNGTVAHAAFFSTQWSKPISTGLGGVAFTGDEALAERIRRTMRGLKLAPPSRSQRAMLAAQRLLRPLADHPALHYPLVKSYRFLTQRLGLSVGSSSTAELASVQMPADYLQVMGAAQKRGWQRGLAELASKVRQRRQTAAYYDRIVESLGLRPPHRPRYAEHAMLRYALRVPNKTKLLARARQHHIPVGDWFVSPLHPLEGDLSQWGYQWGQCPVAEQACREVINLFTDRPLSDRQVEALFGEGVSQPSGQPWPATVEKV